MAPRMDSGCPAKVEKSRPYLIDLDSSKNHLKSSKVDGFRWISKRFGSVFEATRPLIDVDISISSTPNCPLVPALKRLPNLEALKALKALFKWRDSRGERSDEEIEDGGNGLLDVLGHEGIGPIASRSIF